MKKSFLHFLLIGLFGVQFLYSQENVLLAQEQGKSDTTLVANEAPDYIYVGAGPVGVFSAVILKMIDPTAKITMIERNQEYARDNSLFIQSSSFLPLTLNPVYPLSLLNPLSISSGIIRKSPHWKKFKSIINQFTRGGQKTKIKTKEIEGTLASFATEDLGIQIIRGFKVEKLEDISQRFPHTKTVIATDGAHSTVRKLLAKNPSEEFSYKKSLEYIIDVKYQIEGNVKAYSDLQRAPLMAKSGFLMAEHVEKFDESEDKTTMHLRLVVDEDTFKEVQDAKFKTPFALDDSRIPDKLKKAIKNFLHFKEQQGEINSGDLLQKEESSELTEEEKKWKVQLTSIELAAYISSQMHQTDENGVDYFLLGDAAFGVPYFRSLNNGFISAITTAPMLKEIHHSKFNMVKSLETGKYEAALKTQASSQVFQAWNKSLFHDLQKVAVVDLRLGKLLKMPSALTKKKPVQGKLDNENEVCEPKKDKKLMEKIADSVVNPVFKVFNGSFLGFNK